MPPLQKVNNKVNILVIVLGVAIVLLGIYFFANRDSLKYNWHETYDKDSEEPYGLSYLHDLLEHQYDKNFLSIEKSLSETIDTTDNNALYLYIGSTQYLDSIDTELLLRFVEKGNNALIIAQTPHDSLVKKLAFTLSNYTSTKMPSTTETYEEEVYEDDDYYNYEEEDEYYDDEYDYDEEEEYEEGDYAYEDAYYYAGDYLNFAQMPHDSIADCFFYRNTGDSSYSFTYYYGKEAAERNWSFLTMQDLDSDIVRDSMRVDMGYIDTPNQVNFTKIKHGKGSFYFHTNPVLFTNFFFIKEKGFAYSDQIFAALPNHDKLYWDEGNPFYRTFNINQKNPIAFIFEYPGLKWGFYWLLTVIILYVFFKSKRMQRVIPIRVIYENSTLAYVKAVGQLYFKLGRPGHLAEEMHMLFLADIRKKFNIATNKEEAELIPELARVSKVPEEEIKAIFRKFMHIKLETDGSSSKDLIDLDRSIKTFFKKSK